MISAAAKNEQKIPNNTFSIQEPKKTKFLLFYA